MKKFTPSLLLALALSATPLIAQDATTKPLDLLLIALNRVDNPESQANILRGINASLKGRHGLTAPAAWDALYEKLEQSPNEEVRREALALGVTFGGNAALAQERKTVTDAKADQAARHEALEALLAAKDAQTLPLLLDLTKQSGPLRALALSGLAEYEDSRITSAILDVFSSLDTTEKRDALTTLFARPASARAFLAAVDAKTFAKSEITAPTARQLQDLHDPEVDAWLSKNWGAVRTSPADKQAQIARMKQFLSTDSILRADAPRGRAVFTQTCAICHTLFGYGAKIGPELPGSFEDIDYLLLNIVDPDAIIGKDYLQTLVHTKDGQTVSGIIAADDNNSVTLKSLAGQLTVQRSDIASMEVSPHSLMPEGLITSLDQQTVRDLFLYLRQRGQIPMLATTANAADFFNGGDLSHWHTSAGDAWKIEDGELIGHGGTGKATSLLSNMIADGYKLSMMVKLSGNDPVAEFAYHGRPDVAPFVGESFSFGRDKAVNTWIYTADKKATVGGPVPTNLHHAIIKTGVWTKLEIELQGANVLINVDGVPAYAGPAIAKDQRNGFAFYLLGPDTELRVKDVKLEVATK